MIHVLAVAVQFLVYRRYVDCRLRDDALSAQDHEQVPQRRPMVTSVVMYCASARALRQMLVEEFDDQRFVDLALAALSSARPLGKMCYAT